MKEDKQQICDLLLKALQTTSGAYDLITLEYIKEDEKVKAKFLSGGVRIINVAMDSGTAMIRDIMRGLGV